jgi:regulator of nonsense transcripts 1
MNSQTMTLDVPEEDIRSALTEVKEATSFRPNDSQEDAIVWALQRRISLIRGPPGTGKTKVAALLIATALRLQHDETKPPRVLAVTHSNGAADVLLEALLQMGVPAVRLGRPASVSPNVQHRTVIAMSERMPQVVRLRQQASDMTLDSQERSSAAFELRHMTLDVQQMIVRTAPVVVCSCIGAHQLLENNNTAFPVVVLDEAAQTTEPALICALAASKAEQLVLVGDTRQLPPTITSTDQKLRDTLGVSPMARLETCGVDETTLRIQYRMPPMLLEHPSRYFYKGLVRSAPDNLLMNMRPPAGFPWPSQRPLAFVQTGTGDSEVSHNFGGRSNPTEAQVVARVVSNLLAAGDVDDTSISVLSPYTKQVQLIRSHLATKRNGQDVRVGTVDSFQGQETDVVVFSAVRSNPLRELGFLRDSRRLCVAITRARRGLILVGDQSTLKSCRHWAALLESCEQRGCCMEAKDLEPATETKDTGRQRRQDTLVDLLDKEDEFYGLF